MRHDHTNKWFLVNRGRYNPPRLYMCNLYFQLHYSSTSCHDWIQFSLMSWRDGCVNLFGAVDVCKSACSAANVGKSVCWAVNVGTTTCWSVKVGKSGCSAVYMFKYPWNCRIVWTHESLSNTISMVRLAEICELHHTNHHKFSTTLSGSAGFSSGSNFIYRGVF